MRRSMMEACTPILGARRSSNMGNARDRTWNPEAAIRFATQPAALRLESAGATNGKYLSSAMSLHEQTAPNSHSEIHSGADLNHDGKLIKPGRERVGSPGRRTLRRAPSSNERLGQLMGEGQYGRLETGPLLQYSNMDRTQSQTQPSPLGADLPRRVLSTSEAAPENSRRQQTYRGALPLGCRSRAQVRRLHQVRRFTNQMLATSKSRKADVTPESDIADDQQHASKLDLADKPRTTLQQHKIQLGRLQERLDETRDSDSSPRLLKLYRALDCVREGDRALASSLKRAKPCLVNDRLGADHRQWFQRVDEYQNLQTVMEYRVRRLASGVDRRWTAELGRDFYFVDQLVESRAAIIDLKYQYASILEGRNTTILAKWNRVVLTTFEMEKSLTDRKLGLNWLWLAQSLRHFPAVETYRLMYRFIAWDYGPLLLAIWKFQRAVATSPFRIITGLKGRDRKLDHFFIKLHVVRVAVKELRTSIREYASIVYERAQNDFASGHLREAELTEWLQQHQLQLAKSMAAELKDPSSPLNRGMHKRLRSKASKEGPGTQAQSNKKFRPVVDLRGDVVRSLPRRNRSQPADPKKLVATPGAPPEREPRTPASSTSKPAQASNLNGSAWYARKPTTSGRSLSSGTSRAFSIASQVSTGDLCPTHITPLLSYTVSSTAMQEHLAECATNKTKACWTYELYRGPDGKPPVRHYCTTLAHSEQYASVFLHEEVLGFDLEWKPNTASKGASIKEGVSTIQLASESHTAVFHIALHSGNTLEDLIAPTLRTILESPDIVKAGVSILGDRTRLANYLGVTIRSAFELSHLYKVVKWSESNPELVNRSGVKLTTQCEEYLGLPLNKDENIRGSNWSQSARLNKEQLVYAASDAYVSVHLYDTMNRLRLQMQPPPPMPEFAELKPEREAKAKTSKRPVTTAVEREEDDDQTGELLDDGEYKPATPRAPSTSSPLPFSSVMSTSATTRTPRRPRPASSPRASPSIGPEIFAADEWIALHHPQHQPPRPSASAELPAMSHVYANPSTDPDIDQLSANFSDLATSEAPQNANPVLTPNGNPKPPLNPRFLRPYHLFHHQSLSIPAIARLLRTPSLANFTVASYISEAVCTGRLDVDVARAEEVEKALGPSRAGRWRRVVASRGTHWVV